MSTTIYPVIDLYFKALVCRITTRIILDPIVLSGQVDVLVGIMKEHGLLEKNSSIKELKIIIGVSIPVI